MQHELKKIIAAAILTLQTEGKLPSALKQPEIQIERTRERKFGDFASNIAMLLAKGQGLNPREVASWLVAALPKVDLITKVEIAGPGFINFYLAPFTWQKIVGEILNAGANYGRVDLGKDESILLEFVSSNPTGPLHVGHGRGAAFGATLANLLQAAGFKVHCEYYVNDAGRQMDILTISIWLRYLELVGENIHLPTNCYRGDYIIDIARRLHVEFGAKLQRQVEMLYQDLPLDADQGGDADFYIDAMVARAKDLLGKNDYEVIFQRGLTTILADMRQDLEEFGVTFQEWFHESWLFKNAAVAEGVERLQALGHVYEKDGAVWFRATTFGDEKDRVVIRENGQYTYFASDIAYHLNKYERGFDRIIDILGSDHHGYTPRIRAFLSAAGLDVNKFLVLFVQFAILYRGKTKVQMSTRSGTFVTLRELRNEVGNDAARFFYIMRKNDQHLDFDLELAKSQSKDNPVYYIQYAHARICSVMRQLIERQLDWKQEEGLQALHLLTGDYEEILLKTLAHYPSTLEAAALRYEPHLLAHYLLELANFFHTYYNAEQFLVTDDALRNARLCLINAVKQVLANGLVLLGVSAPEMM
jgi:arginyl-tRNA synthetase